MQNETQIKVVEIQPFTRTKDLPKLLGISRSALYVRVRKGILPPFQMLGGYGTVRGYNAKTLESILNGEYFNEREEV